MLINTAKDLLKQDGCELFGRFFIALLGQAVQERSAIPEGRRRATFVYIDEAQDYFDEAIENLLNQARKYRVGLVLAHQNLGQFDGRLAEAVMASTAIKLAGGVSAKDAWTLSRDMRCEPDFLLAMHKHQGSTDFACFIRNVTPQPVALTVPFGQMEGRPRIEGRVDQPSQNAPSMPLGQVGGGGPIGMRENFARQKAIIGGRAPLPTRPKRRWARGLGGGGTPRRGAPK